MTGMWLRVRTDADEFGQAKARPLYVDIGHDDVRMRVPEMIDGDDAILDDVALSLREHLGDEPGHARFVDDQDVFVFNGFHGLLCI